ncbi:uncharacterized protein LOC132757959 [Ruditapes philippinarum]|uniref:uncharacterized protein LOC132757959 n=1 Tax=Ruditapes philippinarum TaxID=129788 RepID=UPI00295AAD91|nr:uncharacterized protein LOC132757959 [Ruditapes philippinarum]
MFYGKEVELDGYFAQLQIKDEEESDFDNYTLVIDNGIGSYKSWILKHVSQSKPSVPRYFNFTGFKDGIPTFLLVGNFNGGLLQTFVVETTEAGKDNWMERLKFNETDTAFLQAEKLTFTFNISGLQPNVYDARVRTGNDIGWINEAESPTVKFTIYSSRLEREAKNQIAVVIGGVVSVAVVIAFVALFLILRRRFYKRKECNDNGTSESRTYETLDNKRDEANTYSSVASFTEQKVPDEEVAYENLRLKQMTVTTN